MLRDRAAVKEALPFLVAASRYGSGWLETLQAYQRTCSLLHGIYQPSVTELEHGLRQMENTWSISLFYYGIIKGTCGIQRPSRSTISTVMALYRNNHNIIAMKQVLEEDVDVSTYQGSRSALSVAASGGLWQEALLIYTRNPPMRLNYADTRTLLASLVSQGNWELTLKVFIQPQCCAPPVGQAKGDRSEASPAAEAAPGLLQTGRRWCPQLSTSVIRSLTKARRSSQCLAVLAAVLAAGHELDARLFASVSRVIVESGGWSEALATAFRLGLMTASPEVVSQRVTLYGSLIDALYCADLYADFTPKEVLLDLNARMSPREEHHALAQALPQPSPALLEAATRRSKEGLSMLSPKRGERITPVRRQFRVHSIGSVYHSMATYLTPLSKVYAAITKVPRMYTRLATTLVDATLSDNDAILILDTNFLIQCAAKNLSLEHFYPSIHAQYPHLKAMPLRHIIVPFTTIREAYRLIWDPSVRMRRGVRILLWNRVQALLRRQDVTPLSLASEYPTVAFAMIHRMALLVMHDASTDTSPTPPSKMDEALWPDTEAAADDAPSGPKEASTTGCNAETKPLAQKFSVSGDPDLRILDLCLAFQHAIRAKRSRELMQASGYFASEGTVLFSFFKYHARRLNGQVTGPACNHILLLTLDKRFSALADMLGIDTFPNFMGADSKCKRNPPESPPPPSA